MREMMNAREDPVRSRKSPDVPQGLGHRDRIAASIGERWAFDFARALHAAATPIRTPETKISDFVWFGRFPERAAAAAAAETSPSTTSGARQANCCASTETTQQHEEPIHEA